MSSEEGGSKRPELVDDPDDPELSELLDSALADFGRPLPAAAATAPATSAAPTAAGNAEASDSAAAGVDAESMSEAYKAFEEAMKQALQEAPASAAGGSGDAAFSAAVASLAEEMARANVEGADDPLAKTLADLSKNLSSDAEKMGGEPDMAELLRVFAGAGGGDGGPDGGGTDGGAGSLDALMPLMQTVMSSILSKDVLYPSLKDVSARYPAWLAEHEAALSADELARYRRQHQLMGQVCAVFEEPADGAEAARRQQGRVFQLMQEMQALGQPPKELVGESGLGLQLDEQGNPALPPGLGDGADCAVM